MILNDEMAIKVYNNLGIKEGTVAQADTHAQFLNLLFDTNYKAWMKCVYDIKSTFGEMFVWMVRLNGENHSGWANVDKGDIIEEYNLDNVSVWDGENINTRNFEKPYRIVAEIFEIAGKRFYKIRGLYKYTGESTFDKHILKKLI